MLLVLSLLLLGWISGVIVNYLADILPVTRSFDAPICLTCKSKFEIINYLFWPRRCHHCGNRRNSRVFVIETLYSLLPITLWFFPNNRLSFVFGIVLWIYFGIVIVIDIEHRLILHPVSLTGAILAFALGTYMHGITQTLLGGAAGFIIMFVLYYVGILIVKKMRKPPENGEAAEEEALGFGDVNLSGVMGLLLGWPGIVAGITITIFLAGGFSLFYLITMVILKKYKAYMAIPYGPFIILGTAILLFFVK